MKMFLHERVLTSKLPWQVVLCILPGSCDIYVQSRRCKYTTTGRAIRALGVLLIGGAFKNRRAGFMLTCFFRRNKLKNNGRARIRPPAPFSSIMVTGLGHVAPYARFFRLTLVVSSE